MTIINHSVNPQIVKPTHWSSSIEETKSPPITIPSGYFFFMGRQSLSFVSKVCWIDTLALWAKKSQGHSVNLLPLDVNHICNQCLPIVDGKLVTQIMRGTSEMESWKLPISAEKRLELEPHLATKSAPLEWSPCATTEY